MSINTFFKRYSCHLLARFMNTSYTGIISLSCNVRFKEAVREATAVDELISRTVNEEDGAIERYCYYEQNISKTSLVQIF